MNETIEPWVSWEESGQRQNARWRCETRSHTPTDIVAVDDTLTANTAYRLIGEGKDLLWRGDFQNARQLLQALARRTNRPARVQTPRAGTPPPPPLSAHELFNQHRQAQARRASILNRVLLPFNGDHAIALRRAPDARAALAQVWGPADGLASVCSLRELQGLIGAYEWRRKGVEITALGAHIYPHYSVFSPVRGEYIQLVAQAVWPGAAAPDIAFDIGTGTGVLAALLARRGVERVIATDVDGRALMCARDNIARLGLSKQVEVLAVNMFPPGRAALIVCNPPWIPTAVNAAIERAVYDPDSAMLRAFLSELAAHLRPGGEGWLILSDLAEHLELRTRDQLLTWISDGGLRVAERLDIRPTHPKAGDKSDPLHQARCLELTSLWRLVPRVD